MPSILLLFLGDPATDRRLQNFERFFRQAGWYVEVLTLSTRVAKGPLRFLSYDRRLKRAVRSKRTDVVMACDLYSLGAAVTMKRLSLAQQVIYDSREVYTELPTVAHRPLVKFAWKWYERSYIDEVNRMIVTGPHDADAIRQVHAGIPRTVLVRNLPWKTEVRRDRSLLNRVGLDPSVTTLVYIGGLQRGRGLQKLIPVMRALREQLLILGGGVLDAELRDLAIQHQVDDRVKFGGAVPADEALAIAAACDVGVSLIEPISRSYELALPSKIFEYMMVGLPVVSTRLIQVIELFENEPWIEFVDVNNEADIERGIRAAIAQAGDTDRRTREQTLASQEYHFEADASRLLDALHH